MTGRALVLAFLAFLLLFSAGLWWAQTYAWWQEVEGLETVEIAGAPVAVSDYRGLRGDSSPLKLRGCFTLDEAPEAPPAEDPAPLTTPGWFDCFDAARLGADLEAGRARALLAERDDPEGFDRVVALYPDGRAYLWRQLREE